MSLFTKIDETISTLNVETIPEYRKETLNSLSTFVQDKVNANEEIRLNFICTHNSRRSHLSQVWAQVLAYNFNIKQFFSYSGGTEATALFPMVADTLKNTGFEIASISKGDNPIYGIKYAANQHPVIGFSKKFNDSFNPTASFAAIMTCSSADEACPFVAGAEKRVPLTFEDPKAFDNTPQQAEKYMERSLQIATELFYVFSQIQA